MLPLCCKSKINFYLHYLAKINAYSIMLSNFSNIHLAARQTDSDVERYLAQRGASAGRRLSS